MIFQTLAGEGNYFNKRLSKNIRRIFFSNVFQIAASSILSIFVGAFIYRLTGSLIYVAAYVVGKYVGLPLGHYLNGLLLRRIPISTMYWVGALAYGLTTILIIWFSGGGAGGLFICGCIQGLAAGLYWGNRNYLELQETVSNQRQYYFSMIYASTWLSGIIVPFIAGWFIILGSRVGLFSQEHAYWILFVAALLLMAGSAATIARGAFKGPSVSAPILLKALMAWTPRRILCTAYGVIDGTGFIIVLLILLFLGKEGALGTITGAVSLLTVCVIYIYGRFMDGRHRRKELIAINGLFVLCAGLLAVIHAPWTIIIYVVFAPIAESLFGLVDSPMSLGLAEQEMAGRGDLKYAMICDNELFLNIGRISGAVLVVLAIYFSPSQGIFYGSVCAGLLQTILLAIFFKRQSLYNAGIN